jgi:hypothetical protein
MCTKSLSAKKCYIILLRPMLVNYWHVVGSHFHSHVPKDRDQLIAVAGDGGHFRSRSALVDTCPPYRKKDPASNFGWTPPSHNHHSYPGFWSLRFLARWSIPHHRHFHVPRSIVNSWYAGAAGYLGDLLSFSNPVDRWPSPHGKDTAAIVWVIHPPPA